MRLVALADDREDFGLSTEGGDIIGEVTLEGTLFVLFTLVYGMLVPPLVDRLAPGAASRFRWGRGLVGTVLVLSVVSADGAPLMG